MRINDYRVVRRDERNLVVEKRGTIQRGDNEGEETWRTVGFYPNPKAAVRRIRKELAMDGMDETNTLEELMEWLREHAE